MAKTILQGTVKGEKRQGRQKKSLEDNIREWTNLEFAKSQMTVENRKMEKSGREIICGAPTTLAIKGLMMMMMMMIMMMMIVSYLVGALSPVHHRELHQG